MKKRDERSNQLKNKWDDINFTQIMKLYRDEYFENLMVTWLIFFGQYLVSILPLDKYNFPFKWKKEIISSSTISHNLICLIIYPSHLIPPKYFDERIQNMKRRWEKTFRKKRGNEMKKKRIKREIDLEYDVFQIKSYLISYKLSWFLFHV